MEYHLTEHAQDVLKKRQIRLEWMEQVLAAPEWTEKDSADEGLEHRLAPIPEFGNRVLRVILNIKTIPPRIVTAYFDRRRTGR